MVRLISHADEYSVIMAGVYCGLFIIFTTIACGIYSAREYIVEIVKSTTVTKSMLFVFSVVLFVSTLQVGAIDIGVFGTIVITVSAILTVYPVYLQTSRLHEDKNATPDIGMIMLVVIAYTVGLYITPAAAVVPGLSESGGHLTVYAVVGFGAVLSTKALMYLYDPPSETLRDCTSKSGHTSYSRKSLLRRR